MSGFPLRIRTGSNGSWSCASPLMSALASTSARQVRLLDVQDVHHRRGAPVRGRRRAGPSAHPAATSVAAVSSIASSSPCAAASAYCTANPPPATNAGACRGASVGDARSGPSMHTTRSGSSSSSDDSASSSPHTRPLSAARVAFDAMSAASGLTYVTFAATDTYQVVSVPGQHDHAAHADCGTPAGGWPSSGTRQERAARGSGPRATTARSSRPAGAT